MKTLQKPMPLMPNTMTTAASARSGASALPSQLLGLNLLMLRQSQMVEQKRWPCSSFHVLVHTDVCRLTAACLFSENFVCFYGSLEIAFELTALIND